MGFFPDDHIMDLIVHGVNLAKIPPKAAFVDDIGRRRWVECKSERFLWWSK